MTQFKNHKQQGAALAISLILLVAMTILGVATLNGTRLAEKVSSNAQQKAIVYETAESVINAIYDDRASLPTRLAESMSTRIDPPAVPQNLESDVIEQELDQTNTFGKSVDVNADAEIQYCLQQPREGNEIGSNTDLIGYHHDIRVVSTIDNSRARAEHVLRIETGGPKQDYKGNCNTPGK